MNHDKPRSLTTLEIDRILAKKKYAKARRIAVMNFLSSLGGNSTFSDAFANLEMDARLYAWKAPTVNAILEGIKLAS